MAGSLDKALKNYAAQASKKAVAGFFPSARYPAVDGGEQVAEVAMKQEYGSFLEHIPPRPFFRPAIANNKAKWSKIVAEEIKRGLSIENALESVSLRMQGDIRDAIIDVTTPELSEYTLKMRRERGNSSTKPLEDTGYMLASVTSTVQDR